MGNSIAKILPAHLRLLSDPQMMRTLANQAVIKIGGLEEMVTWAKRSDENQGKLYTLAAKLAPKEVAVSGSIGIEGYIDALDAAERNGQIIDGEFQLVDTAAEAEPDPHANMFLWPDVFHVDFETA